jgi:hypothetical protein
MMRALTGLVLVFGLLRCGTATDDSAYDATAPIGGDVQAGDVQAGDVPAGDVPAGDVLAGDIQDGSSVIDSTRSDLGPRPDLRPDVAPFEPVQCTAPVASANLELGDAPGDDEPGSRYTATCGRVFFATADGGLRSLEPDQSTRDWLAAGSGVRWPDGAGNRVAFAYGSPPQVHVLNLESGVIAPVDPTDTPQLRPRVSATSVVWEDERSGYAQVWRRDEDGAAIAVDPSTADQRFLAMSGGRVVWTDFRAEDDDGRWSGDGGDSADLWVADSDGARALVVAPHKQAFADLDGDQMVWLDWRNIDHDEDGHPQPEPKLGNFQIYWASINGALKPEIVKQVFGGSYRALPSLGSGLIAYSGATFAGGASTVHVVSPMGEELSIVGVGIQGDLPMIGLNSLVYTAVEMGDGQLPTRTMHVVPLPSP